MDTQEPVARGERALAAGRWEEARDAFAAALAEEESPVALLGLADALWWLADAPGCVVRMEQAYALLRQAGEDAEAVVTAVWLAILHKKVLGNHPACSGWVARAQRLIGGHGDDLLQGWVLLARAYEAPEPQEAAAAARWALAIARIRHDVDLELCALGELGRALVAAGEIEAGLGCVDEAVAGALGGEAGHLETVVAATCSMVMACDLVADLDRVAQWCRAADRFMRTYGSPFLFADCRMRFGSVLLATGDWDAAERELTNALQAAPPETDYHAQARARLAELWLRQGRLEDAEALIADADGQPVTWPVAAALRHTRGEHVLAAALLTRRLEAAPPAGTVPLSAPDAARALGLLLEVHLACGDFSAAQAAAEQLDALGREQRTDQVVGHGALAAGRVALAAGATREAAALFEQAVDRFSRARLPYDAALARLEVARALSADQPEMAVAEAQGACAAFERLGAPRDVDAAAALLRSLGAPARTGPKSVGVLSAREQQVLRLLGEGLSNLEIAERLYISRKTASHHVSSILAKLGLRNRAEAAAYTSRRAGARTSH